jgi:AAA domain
MSAEHKATAATAGPIRYAFGELVQRLGLDLSAKTTTTVVAPLQARASTGSAERFRLNQAACAGLVNIDETTAAAPYLPTAILTNYDDWRDNWLFPIADAIRLAPHHAARLREIFDRENRRTADPAKATEDKFANALTLLDHAVVNPPDGQKISFTRIPRLALEHGWDGRTVAQRQAQEASVITTVVAPGGAAAFFEPIPFEQSDLRPVSWLVDGWLIRGEPTVLAGQGGGAKTAFAVMLAVALAAGRNHLGPLKINTRPGGLRVAYLTGEEDRNRLGLLIAAACNVLALAAAERALVRQNLLLHDVAASALRIGAPRPEHREDLAPEAEDRALSRLAAALPGIDVVIFDTIASCLSIPNENDNGLITTLLGRLIRVARAAGCALLLLHHAPKQNRESAAGQRGEVTLVRGGSAFVNVARVVLTITSPTAAEAGQFAVMGLQADRLRRVEHAKVNDAPPMSAAYFRILSELVTVHDGSSVPVRAVEFIAMPAAGGSITNALRNTVMKVIDVGAHDAQGARVPLSLNSGGSDNRRGAIPKIAEALTSLNSAVTAPQAKALAREILKDLLDRGCVVEQTVQVPMYKATSGTPNGTRTRRGLLTNWQLAPWVSTTTAPQPSSPNESGAPLPSGNNANQELC